MTTDSSIFFATSTDDSAELEACRHLFMTMTQGVVYQSAEGRIIAANPAAARILGMDFTEMRERTSLDPAWRTIREDGSELPGAEHPSMLALMRGEPILGRVLGVYNPERRQHRWLTVDAVPRIRRGETRPWQVYTTFQDITERKQTEEALRLSEERFRLTFQASPDAVNINRLVDGLYVEVNEGFCKLTGFSREEVVGKTSAEMNIWHNPDDRLVLVQGLREKGSYNGLEAKFRRKDGRIAHGRMSARVIQLNGIPHILSVTRDVTDETEAIAALSDNKNLLDSILRTAPTAIGVVSNRVFIMVNDRICTMTGYSKEELLGRSSRMLYQDDAEYEKVGLEKYRQISASGIGSVETRWQCKTGEAIDILLSSSPLDPVNLALGVTFTALDISEGKRAAVDKEKLQAQLAQAQKMDAVGRLAGGIAHDFNNMLGVILGRAEMLVAKTDPEGELFKELQEISKAAKRSADLTRQLLAFARQQTINPKVLDLNHTLKSMLLLLRRLIGENIELAWRPGRMLPSIKMDPSQLDQILANLCINARDAISGVGKIILETDTVTLDEEYCATRSGCVPGRYVLLVVSDNGVGMAKDVQEKIFEPFFTTKNLGKGTGLGLATIYGIVKQNKGYVNVYSEPGQGTTFRIYLPEFHGQLDTLKKEARTNIMSTGRETILLVEDEQAILDMTEKMLLHLGYTVLAASTPHKAIEIASQHSGVIDMVLTDVVMPRMNGWNLSQQLMLLQPKMKPLFMSGYTANVIAHQGVLDEGVRFIEKPFSQQALGRKIREILDEGPGG